MTVEVREARGGDAPGMAALLNRIIQIGGTTAHARPFDAARIDEVFLSPPFFLRCFAAEQEGRLLGFQALEWCDPDWAGENPQPGDWAVISSFVDPGAHRRGIGRRMFAATDAAAAVSGVRFIDATIRKENAGGLAFYDRLGFETYFIGADSISKRRAPG